MLEGLMQNDYQLTLKHVLDRMRGPCARRRGGDAHRRRHDARVLRRGRRARGPRWRAALESLGVKQGDRVATFMWNSQQHLELYMAAPCMGAVLHTLNIRLFPEQLTYIVNHAKDKVIFVDDSLVPLLEKVAPTLRDRRALRRRRRRRRRLAAERDPLRGAARASNAGLYDYPELDERTAAGLCYTSGTTGNPKGVLYSHRSNVLHCLAHRAGRHDRHHGVRPRAARRPDVPRERVGLPVRVRDGRRRPRDARAASCRPSRSRS